MSEMNKMKKYFTGMSDDQLKTIVVLVITVAWLVAVIVGFIDPSRQIDTTITTMMGAVVGYFLVDKFKSEKK